MSELPDKDYFLRYQTDLIMEEARLGLAEKSIRIGFTYGHAMRAVRRRMVGTFGDLLHTSVNERIAKEFITDCQNFCRIYDVVGASGVEEFPVWNEQESRNETAFEIRFKQQDTAIKAFSSNPAALRGTGGEVNVDEISSHKNPDAMIQAAGGRAMWGFAVRIWSSHKGAQSVLNRKLKEERALGDASRWKIQSVDLYQAVSLGLIDKINEVRGTSITRDDFIADTIALVGGQEAFEEECLLKPRASGGNALKWEYIDGAKTEYNFIRKHLEGDEPFDVVSWLGEDLLAFLRICPDVAIGYDVARTGHLSAVPILAKVADAWRVVALVTMQKRSFGGQRDIVAEIMRAVPVAVAAGDSTGLGMQICEELTNLFGEQRFVSVNFGAHKPDLGTKLVRVFEDGRCEIPATREDEDIAFDLHCILTDTKGVRARFYESQNPVNKLSHCDIAWAIALALFVGEDNENSQGVW